MTAEWDIILLLIATFSGWMLGRTTGVRRGREVKKPGPPTMQALVQWYRLQHEIDIQKILDTFEVTPETLDVHFSLADMYRKKGEHAKSLAIHQNIFGRPDISATTNQKVQFELAIDYVDLGMLGRAEALLKKLVDDGSDFRLKSLQMLVQIYEIEKDWQKCVDTGEQFGRKMTDEQRLSLSHHYCELAQICINRRDLYQAQLLLKRASSVDSTNARAWLDLGLYEAARGRYKRAMNYVRKAGQKNAYFISEAVNTGWKIAQEGDCYRLYQQLLDHLATWYSLSSVQLARARIAYYSNPEAAMAQLTQDLETPPSRKVVFQLLEWQKLLDGERSSTGPMLDWLHGLVKKEANYQCQHCGFETVKHYWQCGQCRHWGTVQDKEDHDLLAQRKLRGF